MIRLYNAVLLPLRLVLGAWGRSGIPGAARRAEWRERLAQTLPSARPGGAWIHGSSVGEARIVRELARGLSRKMPGLPLAVSALTPTGRRELSAFAGVEAAFFMPFDFPGYPRRLLRSLKPRLLAIVETELWPNLLAESHAEQVPVMVVNGRLSAERMVSYRRLGRLYRPLLARLTAVGAQSDADAERFEELGVPPVAIHVTGNVKYDLPPPPREAAALRRELGLPDARPLFVAGSTAHGEDAPVLEALRIARRLHPSLTLILAPRHPERADDVERLVREAGLRVGRWSSGCSAADVDVVLVDTIGPLKRLYALGVAAFVGGSLVPVGGHNVLEPAAAGVPVLFGPHTESVREPAAALIAAGGAIRVADARELGEAVGSLAGDGARAAAMSRSASRVLEANRGALERSLELLVSILRRDARGGEAR